MRLFTFWWYFWRVSPPSPIRNVENIFLDDLLSQNRFKNIAQGGGGQEPLAIRGRGATNRLSQSFLHAIVGQTSLFSCAEPNANAWNEHTVTFSSVSKMSFPILSVWRSVHTETFSRHANGLSLCLDKNPISRGFLSPFNCHHMESLLVNEFFLMSSAHYNKVNSLYACMFSITDTKSVAPSKAKHILNLSQIIIHLKGYIFCFICC